MRNRPKLPDMVWMLFELLVVGSGFAALLVFLFVLAAVFS